MALLSDGNRVEKSPGTNNGFSRLPRKRERHEPSGIKKESPEKAPEGKKLGKVCA